MTLLEEAQSPVKRLTKIMSLSGKDKFRENVFRRSHYACEEADAPFCPCQENDK